MASRVAGKIKLQSVDELLGVPEIAGTQEIEIERIHAFPNHPFKVLDDEKMDTLVDSIRENGILNPVIVRPDQSGNYEMISGHRRLHAAKIVGLKKVPAIVKEMSDDEAIIKMVDANIQREEILPSERAFSFKMKMEAMKRRGYRSDLDANDSTSGTEFPKSDKWSRDIVGSEAGMTGRQVTKYIRLTELIQDTNEVEWEHYTSMREYSGLTLKDGKYNLEDVMKSMMDAYETRYNYIVKEHENGERQVSYDLTGENSLTLDEDLAGLDRAYNKRLANLAGYIVCQQTNDGSKFFQTTNVKKNTAEQKEYIDTAVSMMEKAQKRFLEMREEPKYTAGIAKSVIWDIMSSDKNFMETTQRLFAKTIYHNA